MFVTPLVYSFLTMIKYEEGAILKRLEGDKKCPMQQVTRDIIVKVNLAKFIKSTTEKSEKHGVWSNGLVESKMLHSAEDDELAKGVYYSFAMVLKQLIPEIKFGFMNILPVEATSLENLSVHPLFVRQAAAAGVAMGQQGDDDSDSN